MDERSWRALVHAIAADELVLHYQPIVELTTGRIDGYEALVRWDRPGAGLLHPTQFLHAAEASDLVRDLDAWVLRAAVGQLARWNRERCDEDLEVVVHLSRRHLSQPRIQHDVAMALGEATVAPHQLVLAVSGAASLAGGAGFTNLEALARMGVLISLDDLGTSDRSDSRLSRLPVDVLRIDRRYVDANVRSSRSLLELTVKTAHAFGIRVVAEGVEHPDQLDLVRRLGCEQAQGFHLGMPAPAERLSAVDAGRLLAG